MRRTRRYRSAGAVLARAIGEHVPDALVLLCAETGHGKRDIIAAMLFARHGASATYLIGATSDRGRTTCAHHLILATACDLLRGEGVGWIDLGQIDTEANPGLARFKLGAGARLHPLGGSWLRLPFAASPLCTGRAGSPKIEALHR
jgi:lipid II:glycine glycyltransferase (peptidoglycan interpeptide bridge formation enzyme)